MANDLEVTQSPKQMAVGEAIAWTFDFSDIGTPASVTAFLAYDETMTDKSSVVLSGSTSISGDVVTGKLFAPASEQDYTLICKVSISGNTVIGTMLVPVYDPVAGITLSNGYATIKELRRYLAPGTAADKFDDEVIAHLIEAASRYIDSECGTTFYARTETHYFDIPEGRELYFDDDLIAVTTLTNGDSTTISSSYYKLLPYNSSPKIGLRLVANTPYFWQTDSSGNVEGVLSVAGTWGVASSTTKDIKEATLQLARNIYKRRFGENEQSVASVTAAGMVITPEEVPLFTRQVISKYKRRL